MESNGSSGQLSELFTDLDPLGTGKSKPYVDRKDFFSELKTSSPKLASVSRDRSPVPPQQQHLEQQPQINNAEQVSNVCSSDVDHVTSNMSTNMSCLPTSSSVASFIRNNSRNANVNITKNTEQAIRNSSRHYSGSQQQQPLPPPRNGSELSYGTYAAEQIDSRKGLASTTDARFGFSAHLATRSSNPASNITTMARSWRSTGQNSSTSGSGIHDTRLYHTLGRPMTTFNRPTYHDVLTTSEESSIITVSLPDTSDQQDASTTGQENRYGSIPQLEASPRRYNNRGKEHHEFLYSTNNNNLAVLPRQPADGASVSEIPPKLPEKPSKRTNQVSPPPLPPKKPIKGLIGITNYNRPLPSTTVMEHPPPDVVAASNYDQNDDIYDFPPMPMLGSIKMDKEEARQCISDILQSQDNNNTSSNNREQPDYHTSSHHYSKSRAQPVSVEELSKMSLIELNSKLMAGQLPEELKGMSIMELVEYINQQTKAAMIATNVSINQKPDVVTTSSYGIKPSFSDNFVCDMLPKQSSATDPTIEENITFEPSSASDTTKSNILPKQQSPDPSSTITNKDIGFVLPPPATQNIHHNKSSGFDDDFTPYSINKTCNNLQQPSTSRPSSQATSVNSVLSQSKPDEYDKYAVFRELQMEEELIRAWKTPSDEEKPGDDEVEDEDEDNVEEEREICDEMLEHANEQIAQDVVNEDQNSYKNQPICSSEGSPCSRSDTQSPNKSFSVEDQPYAIEERDGALTNDIAEQNEYDEDPSELNKRDSQVPIFHHNDEDEDSVCQSIKSDKFKTNTQDEDNVFSCAFGPDASNSLHQSKNWTTFDDELDDQPSISSSQQQKHYETPRHMVHHTNFTSHEHAFQDNFGDTPEWPTIIETEQQQQPVEEFPLNNEHEAQATITRQASNDSNNQPTVSKCQRFSHRQCDSGHICSRGHSFEHADNSNTSHDQHTEDPASYSTDWWPPSAEAGVPLKKTKAGSGNDAYTATPDHKVSTTTNPNSSSSGVWGEPQQTENNAVFGESLQPHFKVFSKVVNPNGFDRSGTPNSTNFDALSDSDSGLMPKSDSVNIFGVKDDPFDDDFFQ